MWAAGEDRKILYNNSGCEYNIPNASNVIIKHYWAAPVDREPGGGGWPHKP